MKRLMGLLVVGMVVTAMSAATAAEAKKIAPKPEAEVELFPCVVYKDCQNIAPCAVPKIVQVKDPCQPCCCDPCCCCPVKCVSVKICVPPPDPCACCPCEPKVTCRKGGEKLRLDYGKYAIDVRVKKGFIEVDYDD